ncbi:flagellin, partial [Stenotrophomonas sp. TWI819]|uniref:flagellin n=1 Tax=Stenotrophomonas sp. TWI819 TaxID=3136800 RepID=UPI003207FAB6
SEFNGTKLLDGSFSSQLFQVGANAGQAIAIDKVVDAKSDALGAAKFATDFVGTAATGTDADVATDDMIMSKLQITITPEGGTAQKIAIGDINVKSGESISTATAAAINNKLGETGVYATVKDGAVTLASVKAGQVFAVDALADDSTNDDAAAIVLANVGLAGGGGTGAGTIPAATENSVLKGLTIESVTGAQRALEVVDKALESINSTRADLGAVQNRFTSVVANLQTSTENLSASRSRIKDTDFAKETAELTRTQILQQAGTAMLAQANQVPQNVMSLLR